MNLKAVLLNCTLKKSPEVSNTQALMDNVVHMARILKDNPIPPEGNTVPMKRGG